MKFNSPFRPPPVNPMQAMPSWGGMNPGGQTMPPQPQAQNPAFQMGSPYATGSAIAAYNQPPPMTTGPVFSPSSQTMQPQGGSAWHPQPQQPVLPPQSQAPTSQGRFNPYGTAGSVNPRMLSMALR